jgi:hypothetical protein
MRRVNTRGMAGANKHVLMAALTYNLKKLLKFNRLQTKIMAKALQKTTETLSNTCFYLVRHSQSPIFFV